MYHNVRSLKRLYFLFLGATIQLDPDNKLILKPGISVKGTIKFLSLEVDCLVHVNLPKSLNFKIAIVNELSLGPAFKLQNFNDPTKGPEIECNFNVTEKQVRL